MFFRTWKKIQTKGDQPPSIIDIPMEKQSSSMTTSPTSLQLQPINPIWRLSPWHNGSTLYDSYELRAVTHQLNKAIQGPNGSSPSSSPYLFSLKSPFYQQRLGRIYRENAKTPKGISCSQSYSATLDKKAGAKNTGGLIARLWKKVKKGLVRNNPKNAG